MQSHRRLSLLAQGMLLEWLLRGWFCDFFCAGAQLILFLLLFFAQFELGFSPFLGEWLFFAYPNKSHQKKGSQYARPYRTIMGSLRCSNIPAGC